MSPLVEARCRGVTRRGYVCGRLLCEGRPGTDCEIVCRCGTRQRVVVSLRAVVEVEVMAGRAAVA